MKKEDGENNASTTTPWTGYNGSGSGVTGHLAGLLGQNGQNGSSSVSHYVRNSKKIVRFWYKEWLMRSSDLELN